MSDIPEDDDIKSLLKAALPDELAHPAFEIDALRRRAVSAGMRMRPRRFAALYAAYGLCVLCTFMLGLGLLAERHYARLLHEALLQLPAE